MVEFDKTCYKWYLFHRISFRVSIYSGESAMKTLVPFLAVLLLGCAATDTTLPSSEEDGRIWNVSDITTGVTETIDLDKDFGSKESLIDNLKARANEIVDVDERERFITVRSDGLHEIERRRSWTLCREDTNMCAMVDLMQAIEASDMVVTSKDNHERRWSLALSSD